MKNPALILVITLIATVGFLAACNSPDQKVEEAQSAVVEVEDNRELEEASRKYQADMNQYREEAADRIAANDSMITAFKARMANETADVRATYEKQLAVLEKKNRDMKKKLADYKGEGKEQWETSKAAFNREMDTLSEDFENLTDTNS